MWRRSPTDPAVEAAWAGFVRFADALNQGSRALLATVPSARRPGAPLEASVAGFLAGLEAARAELPSWDHPALADAQAATAAALDAAERAARELPEASEGLEFEHRNERVADVLDELLPVQAAEQAVRALRRRGHPARAGGRQTRQGR
ncbi:MAG TPA: hypothetical protein VFX88_12725 [Actinomycetota bacterium]|nr:hypothetical protein [Actinomycetota bacterium]